MSNREMKAAWDKFIAGCTLNGEPMTANDRAHPEMLMSFYAGWHAHRNGVSPDLDAIRAEAWDEGRHIGQTLDCTPNPYRVES